MTELATYSPPSTPAVTGTGSNAATQLVAWAEAGNAAFKLAQALVETAFCPAHFKGKPQEAMAAIMYGSEVELSPLQSLQGIYVIGGKPALYAKVMTAIVLAKGHAIWTESKTDAKVVVCGMRRGQSQIEREEWTTARAEKAGYTKNAKYRTDPQAMLLARAQSDICRRVAPDALLGIGYTVEEMELTEGPEVTTVKRSRRQAPAPLPEPAPEVQQSNEPARAVEDRVDDVETEELPVDWEDGQ